MNDRARLGGRTFGNYEIALLDAGLALHDLPDRADGVDDRGPFGVGHEGRERLEGAAAIRPACESQHIGLFGSRPVTAACMTCVSP